MVDRRPLADLSDADVQQRLIALGPRLYPATPDLAAQVRQRLESELAPPAPKRPSRPYPPLPVRWARGHSWPLRTAPFSPRTGPGTREAGGAGNEGRPWVAGLGRKALWLGAVLLLLAVAGLVIFPEARTAVADRLGLRGVQIRWIEEVPSPRPSPLGVPLLLGRPVTLDEARAAVEFPVRLPTAAGFDTPREVYLLDQDEGAMVSFVYPAGPGLPETDETGVGALLTQFQGEADRGLVEKGLLAEGPQETQLQAISVAGAPGFWISGAPHGFFFVCYDAGECRQERYRLVGNVLLWELDGVTLRLEAALSLEDALAIAESVSAPD